MVSKSKANKELAKAGKPAPSKFVKIVLDNQTRILQLAGAIVSVILGVIIWRGSSGGVQNLENASIDALSAALFAKTPYMFFCNRGGVQPEGIPIAMSDLNSIVGSKMGFAVLNCSQVLPSGKNIFTRFGIRKDWKPTVFATTPWTKAVQVPPINLKDAASLRSFVDISLAPQSTNIASDKHLAKFCAKLPTCIVFVKGTRYSKEDAAIEEKLVLSYPSMQIGSLVAISKRFSFEDISNLPADQFSMKFHALRNGTHYLSMTYPATWENVQSFVDYALKAPLTKYFEEEGQPVKVITPTLSFKKRSPPPPPPGSEQSDSANEKSGRSKDKSSSNKADSEEEPVDPAEAEARRRQREKERREEMERQRRDNVFQEGEGGSGGSDEDEEEVIEL